MGNLIVTYAMRFVGLNYLWGGDDSIEGFDCSGLALEVLAAFGFKHQDMTAQELYDWCRRGTFRQEARPGALAFFGKSALSVSHVGIVINRDLMIEAGGGGASVTSKDAAARLNAYVRIRPIGHRQDYLTSYFPPYSVSTVVV